MRKVSAFRMKRIGWMREAGLSIADIAKTVGLAEVTVGCYCRKLGFSGSDGPGAGRPRNPEKWIRLRKAARLKKNRRAREAKVGPLTVAGYFRDEIATMLGFSVNQVYYIRQKLGVKGDLARFYESLRVYTQEAKIKRTHYLVSKAIQEGILVRPAVCSVCGAGGRIEGHHDDYALPLDVTWLCVSCHRKVHKGSYS